MQNEFHFLKEYSSLFYSDKTYYLVSGGRGGGKSTQCAAYFLILLMGDAYFRGVVSRYTQKSIKSSIYRDILDLISDWGLNPFIKIDGDEIINRVNGNMIITHSMKLADGTQTSKGKGLSGVTHLLIDESTELPSENEWILLNDSFRTKGTDRKILMLFNPTTTRHWIHTRWFINGEPNPKWFDDTQFIHTTYKCNAHNLDPKKILEWERMKDQDPEYYNHHILGMWQDGVLGRIFDNWNVGTPDPLGEYETFYGLDFGFSSDPAALIEVKKHNNKLYLKELIYETGLTNQDLAERMRSLGIKNTDRIVCDSAEPKSIESLRRNKFNVIPAIKGIDSVQHGIDKIKQHVVFMHHESKNLHKESDLYCWKNGTDKPEDKNNHLIDALRYALGKDRNSSYAFTGSKSTSIYDIDGDIKDPYASYKSNKSKKRQY